MNNKVKARIRPLGILDLLAFKNLVPNRKKIFENGANTPIEKSPHMNALAAAMHPAAQKFIITDIKNVLGDMKQYTLKCENPAYFRAGQYISLKLNIDGYNITRPYSISSSPQTSLSGIYEIAVKKAGFASEYILDNWKIGDNVVASGPQGTFYYESIRDTETVIGIAGGCGITPFLSMARSIADGIENFNLILLYGSKNTKEIAFFDELNDIEKSSNGNIKIVHVLSEEKAKEYEHGFIASELIKKYAGSKKCSIFMCGPQVMYQFVNKEIEKLGFELKYIRQELFGQINDASELKDFPQGALGKKVNMTIHIGTQTYTHKIMTNETILVGIEKSKLSAPSMCRTGECGYCRSKLISGEVFIPKDTDGRRAADKKYGYIHPCSTFALTDIEIDVPRAK